jgi:uncharacterized protein YhfF
MANQRTGKTPGPRWDTAHLCARLSESGYEGELPPVAWFGDNPEQADELAELVTRGRKRATAGLLWRWASEAAPPEAGDRQVIIDWQGEPRAVIEMTEVRIAQFDQVDAEFARDEGEGDLSLEHWRQVHWDFFARECKRLGREPHAAMPVVCMRFAVVHP